MRQAAYGFRSLTMTRTIQARNQQRFCGVIADAEASWKMLMRHIIQGWSSVSSYRVENEKVGLNKIRRVFERRLWNGAQEFFLEIRVDDTKLAHLANIERRFKMKPGMLQPENYGLYSLNDNGDIVHQRTDRVLGKSDMRTNHGCLIIYDMFRKSQDLQRKLFFYKCLELIKAKEFLERVDIFYHRVKARKAVNKIKENWLYSYGDSGNSKKLADRAFNKLGSDDYDYFMRRRAENGGGAAVMAGVQKLKSIFNREPNKFIRRISHAKEGVNDREQRMIEIKNGAFALNGIAKNFRNWSFNKIRTAYHSGLLMHNDYLTRKLEEIKIEYMKKLIQEATYILEGTFKRHRRNDANHFMIRLLNPNIILNKIIRGDNILRNRINIRRYVNMKKGFELMKTMEKKKAEIDPDVVENLVEALKYFFNNRKSEAFGSIQSYVMEFEVLKIEEISNDVALGSNNNVSTVLDNALEKTMIFDKSHQNIPQYNLSRNSIDSRSINYNL